MTYWSFKGHHFDSFHINGIIYFEPLFSFSVSSQFLPLTNTRVSDYISFRADLISVRTHMTINCDCQTFWINEMHSRLIKDISGCVRMDCGVWPLGLCQVPSLFFSRLFPKHFAFQPPWREQFCFTTSFHYGVSTLESGKGDWNLQNCGPY